MVINGQKPSKIENKTQPSLCLQTWLQQNLRISTNHKYRIYRVAALFPEHFQSFTVALQFVFLNNSFGCTASAIFRSKIKNKPTHSTKYESTESFNSSDSLQAPRRTDPSSFSQIRKNFTQVYQVTRKKTCGCPLIRQSFR